MRMTIDPRPLIEMHAAARKRMTTEPPSATAGDEARRFAEVYGGTLDRSGDGPPYVVGVTREDDEELHDVGYWFHDDAVAEWRQHWLHEADAAARFARRAHAREVGAARAPVEEM